MAEENSMLNPRPKVTENPKKRQKLGRKWEQKKMERLTSHKTGPPCQCKRLRCFEVTSEEERQRLITHFNGLANKNEQDRMLASMIQVHMVKQRRPRMNEYEAKFHDHAYTYNIKVTREAETVTIPVCINAFLSVFGITKSRVERIRASLANTGLAPTDGRGKHTNRPLAFTDEKVQRIIDHIRSFGGRQSHCSLQDTKTFYLPEDLNLSKMYNMYLERYPEDKCSYESYRKIFTEKCNVSFGYPRIDPFSSCDRLLGPPTLIQHLILTAFESAHRNSRGLAAGIQGLAQEPLTIQCCEDGAEHVSEVDSAHQASL